MKRPSSYRIFLTRQSEYHVRGHVCFGVRDRRTGQWLESHWALGKCLASAFRDPNGNMCSIGSPAMGEPLYFDLGDRLHSTSPVLSIEEREHLYVAQGLDRISPALRQEILKRPEQSIRDSY